MQYLKTLGVIILLLLSQLGWSHIGSPGVVLQGKAGPYSLIVNVEPPDVIPGVAKVIVYVQGESLSSIKARTLYFRTGDEGAPKADELLPVAGQPGQYAGEVWMMVSGSSSVQLEVEGDKGPGTLVVPVVASSTATRTMPASTGYTLAGLGVLLVFLMMTILGAAVSYGLTPKGESLNPKRKRNLRVGFVAGLLICAGVLYGGNAWWQSWADDYTRFKYKPLTATSSVIEEEGTYKLDFVIDSTNGPRLGSINYVVPDHGKMMHMFLMRIPAMDAFAHLHPQRLDSTHFTSVLPSLPKGKYLVFADIVYLSGYTETIKDTLDLTVSIADHNKKLDKDDAYAFALPADLVDANPPPGEEESFFICGKPGTGVKLKDGSKMVWEGQADNRMYAGKMYNLQFAVYSPEGQPATLETYLGMTGHGAIIRNDGNVYVHLHPVGTYSMAAQNIFEKRLADSVRVVSYPTDARGFRDSVDIYMKNFYAMPEAQRDSLLVADMPAEHLMAAGIEMDGTVHGHMLQFPYVFPTAGQYRIWVMVKRNGQVLTGAFDQWIE